MPSEERSKFREEFPELFRADDKYYGKLISDSEATKYMKDDKQKPYYVLDGMINGDEKSEYARKSEHLVFWFTKDLRTADNVGLHEAYQLAAEHGKRLVTIYILEIGDVESHFISPWQLQFIFDNVQKLKEELNRFNIPLYFKVIGQPKEHKVSYSKKNYATLNCIKEFMGMLNCHVIFKSMEYELDEIRRDIKLISSSKFKVLVYKNSLVSNPMDITTKKGTIPGIFSPFYKNWMKYVEKKFSKKTDIILLENIVKERQEGEFPTAGEFDYTRDLPTLESVEDRYRPLRSICLDELQLSFYKSHYTIGEKEALNYLSHYAEGPILKYNTKDNLSSFDSFGNAGASSRISHYMALGILGANTVVNVVLKKQVKSMTISIEKINQSAFDFLREIAFRDYYKHVSVHWPHLAMNKPFHFYDIKWSYDSTNFKKWVSGKTGFPIVDAGMRQLKSEGYIPNRVRMIVATFLAKDLLIDWKAGELYFLLNLIDGDFSSNNGGWGWCTSTGIDAQPYFRVFNPYLQSERFDPEGNYIRKYVPELKDLKGKSIHNPINALRYYPPVVNHSQAAKRAIEDFREAIY